MSKKIKNKKEVREALGFEEFAKSMGIKAHLKPYARELYKVMQPIAEASTKALRNILGDKLSEAGKVLEKNNEE